MTDISKIACAILFSGLMVGAQNMSSTEDPGTRTTVSPPTTTTAPPASHISWQVSGTNGTCILLTGNFSFAVSYKTADNYSAWGNIPIPEDATVSGSCGPFLQNLVLTWSSGGVGNISAVNNITFLFIKKPVYVNGTISPQGQYSLTSIFGKISASDPTQFVNPATPDQSYYISGSDFGTFNTPLSESYICQSYKSFAADKTGNVYLEMEQVQAEAFHEGTDTQFGEGSVCSKDTYYMILPIMAYTFIALIIAAVLGSFLWRHFRRSGYAQV